MLLVRNTLERYPSANIQQPQGKQSLHTTLLSPSSGLTAVSLRPMLLPARAICFHLPLSFPSSLSTERFASSPIWIVISDSTLWALSACSSPVAPSLASPPVLWSLCEWRASQILTRVPHLNQRRVRLACWVAPPSIEKLNLPVRFAQLAHDGKCHT